MNFACRQEAPSVVTLTCPRPHRITEGEMKSASRHEETEEARISRSAASAAIRRFSASSSVAA